MPLPLPTSFGGREAYVEQLVVMLTSSDPKLFLFPPELADFATAAPGGPGLPAPWRLRRALVRWRSRATGGS